MLTHEEILHHKLDGDVVLLGSLRLDILARRMFGWLEEHSAILKSLQLRHLNNATQN